MTGGMASPTCVAKDKDSDILGHTSGASGMVGQNVIYE